MAIASLTAFMELLPSKILQGVQDDELELDLESLDNATIRKIDVFLRQIFPEESVAGPAMKPSMEDFAGVAILCVDMFEDNDCDNDDNSDDDD